MKIEYGKIFQYMKIVLIEDDRDYAETLIGWFRNILSFRKEDLLLEGELYRETEEWLKDFVPPLGEKIVFVVDGTLNFTPGEDDGVRGNGFDLFSDWISNLINQMTEAGETEKLAKLGQNLCVILNTGSTRNLGDDFGPYARLKKVCQGKMGLLMENCPKRSGPIIEAINRFVLTEGKQPGIERK